MSERESNRNHRRVNDSNADDVIHHERKKKKVRESFKGKSLASNYTVAMRKKSLQLGVKMTNEHDKESLMRTQQDARKIYAKAQDEVDDIDSILLDMVATRHSDATASLNSDMVRQAYTTALGYYRRPNGYYDEMRRRDAEKSVDGFVPPIYKETKAVRESAVKILRDVAFQIDTYGYDEDEAFEGDEIILSDSVKEMKNIKALLPENDKAFEDDVAQFHNAMMHFVKESEKPDSIALAKLYLKYRRSLWSQTRSRDPTIA